MDAIRSIQETTEGHEVEILLKIDDDDAPTVNAIPALEAMGCRIFTGPREKGYGSLPDFYQRLANEAKSKWVMLFNDDAVVEGYHWLDQVLAFPHMEVAFQAEHHCLGGSHYRHDPGAPFPIIPNKCWNEFGWKALPSNADRWVHYYLNLDRRWILQYIKGMTVRHFR